MLKGRAQDIVMRLKNSIALLEEDCCTVENFAEDFKTTPGRLKTALKRLEKQSSSRSLAIRHN